MAGLVMNPAGSHQQRSALGERSPPIIADHELCGKFAEGSYGELWLAKTRVGQFRAVKVVRRDRFPNEAPFRREFEAIRLYEPHSREHEGLVDVLQVGHEPEAGFFYYVMELADPRADGESSRVSPLVLDGPCPPATTNHAPGNPSPYVPHTLESDLAEGARVPVAACVKIGLAITDALHHLHGLGLVHRDVKPANIIFVGGKPKLADPGAITDAAEARTQIGTEGFIPPEGRASPQGDIYSLGKLLYAASTGKAATEFPNPPLDVDSWPDHQEWLELNELLTAACAGHLEQRYASMAEMRADLALIASGQSLRNLRMTGRKFKRALYSAAIALALAIVAFASQKRREIAMRDRLSVIQEKEREQRRQVLVSEAETIRRSLEAGWFDYLRSKLNEAAAIRKDEWLRDKLTESLAGFDARLNHWLTDFSASSVVFDPTGEHLLVGGMKEGVQTLTLDSGQWHLSGLAQPNRVAFKPDGTPVQFTIQDPGTFLLWDLAQEAPIIKVTVPTSGSPGSWPAWVQVPTAISPDGLLVAGASCFKDGSGRYAVWDTVRGKVVLEAPGKVYSLVFSPDGSLFATGDDNGQIELWSLADGKKLTTLREDALSIRALAFGPEKWQSTLAGDRNGHWLLAAGDEGGRINIWDISQHRVRTRLLGSRFHIYTVAFNPDATLLASAGRYEARIWDVAAAQLVLVIRGTDAHTGIAFSPDSKNLALCNQKGFLHGDARLYALESGRGIQTLRGLACTAARIAFSRNGRWLAALSQDWRIGIWETATGQLRHTISAPKGEGELPAMGWIGFSPARNQLSFGSDQVGAIWDVLSGNEIFSWRHDKAAGTWEARDPATGKIFHAEGFPEYFAVYDFDTSGQLVQVLIHPERKPPGAASVARTQPCWTVRHLPTLQERTVAGNAEWPYAAKVVGVLAEGARYLILDGRFRDGGPATDRHRWEIFDVNTGESRWKSFARMERPDWVPEQLWRDPTGTILGYRMGETAYLVETATGRRVGAIPFRAASDFKLGPFAHYWMRLASSESPDLDRFFLYQLNSRTPILSFRTGLRGQFVAQISDDGLFLAFGQSDGTVALCDLQKVRQQLNVLGLGW